MGKHESDDQVDEEFLRQQALGLAKLEEIAAAQAAAKQVNRRSDGRFTND